ncbi:alpha/beta-hydrolase [Nadsonia fulvescens var. elongata DSM 6958]|uniref:Alpha/beta-hydrolase n=1 Tax=Nadsonia fulvescens var. elongata DSM 6958 TaxID=857566 RepID=A0A1E3PHZ6_9ASCO|nr:alpha/beta-hydrolase [Nadsonia fulvescens var. elongata DSM 6958]
MQCYIYRFISFFSCLTFLATLVTIASFKKLKRSFTKKPVSVKPIKYQQLQKDFNRLRTTPEHKLVFDLKYYCRVHGLDLQEVNIVTSDGFILTLQRLIDPNESKSDRNSRYPVLLLHGLLQSSASFLTSGENGIGFYLFRSGYDVWLGNNRVGFDASSGHVEFKYKDRQMWNWGIKEMGTIDLACMINHIKKETFSEKVALVAHSQGTTQTFFALSKDHTPELGQSISCFCALSPAVYSGKLLQKPYWKFVRGLSSRMYDLWFGVHSFMPIMLTMHSNMLSSRVYGFMGYLVFNYLFDWEDSLWDLEIRDRHFIFSPVYVSASLMKWWLGKGGFSDHGCILEEYNSADNIETVWFNEDFPPLALFLPYHDELVDGLKLLNRIIKTESKVDLVKTVHLKDYSHLDVLWAMDVNEQIGKPLKKIIWKTAHDRERRICPTGCEGL